MEVEESCDFAAAKAVTFTRVDHSKSSLVYPADAFINLTETPKKQFTSRSVPK